jgi:hypothetical protein
MLKNSELGDESEDNSLLFRKNGSIAKFAKYRFVPWLYLRFFKNILTLPWYIGNNTPVLI